MHASKCVRVYDGIICSLEQMISISPVYTYAFRPGARCGSLFSTYQTMSVNGLVWARNGTTLDYPALMVEQGSCLALYSCSVNGRAVPTAI